jgi:polar amino acid transport system substrate-binding protein
VNLRNLSACLAFACTAPHALAVQDPEPVSACGGANEWPPSSYYVRRDGQPTAQVTGFSPEVLAAALEGSRFAVRAELLPFARCLPTPAPAARCRS